MQTPIDLALKMQENMTNIQDFKVLTNFVGGNDVNPMQYAQRFQFYAENDTTILTLPYNLLYRVPLGKIHDIYKAQNSKNQYTPEALSAEILTEADKYQNDEFGRSELSISVVQI